MISWITATHDRTILDQYLGASLASTIESTDDELIVIENAPSIAIAYNRGAKKAHFPIRVYVHHDVEILSPHALRMLLGQHCIGSVGMVGVIGSNDRVIPWWTGERLGSVNDTRMGTLDFGAGGTTCAYLDGLLLATRYHVTFDEKYPGWHGYDHDICEQALSERFPNYCLPNGARLITHHTSGPGDLQEVDGWVTAEKIFREKWKV